MRDHPIKIFARSKSLTLADIAVAAGTSRMTLHRVIRGENTTLSLLRRISAATGGAVSVEDLVSVPAGGHDGKVSSDVEAENEISPSSRHVNDDSAALQASAAR